MSPAARRRSARLAPTATPKAWMSKIAVATQSWTTSKLSSPVRKILQEISHGAATSPLAVPATPASSALRPPSTEMHPSKFQQTSFAPSSGLELGFSDIKDPRKRDSTHGSGLDSTPSRIGGVSTSAFSFRVRPPTWNAEKNSKVQEVMAGLEGDVAKFKAELVAAQKEAGQPSGAGVGERTFAKPKGKAGRFSAAHMAEFKKMGSIEGHASAWRVQNARFTPVKPGSKDGAPKTNLDVSPTPHKSNSKRIPTKPPAPEAATVNVERLNLGLKRKQSAASLHEAGRTPNARSGDNARLGGARPPVREAALASAKRMKQNAGDDASTARPESQDGNPTPKPQSTVRKIRSIVRPGFSRPRDPIRPPFSLTKPAVPPVDASPTPRKPEADPDQLLSDDATITCATENMTLGSNTPGSPERNSSPSRFQKARSILRGQMSSFEGPGQKSGIPQLAGMREQQVPASSRVAKVSAPLLTPHTKAAKKVTFTPDTARVAMDQDSPSPYKFGFVGKAKAMLGLENKQSAGSGDIAYPDLSSHLSGLQDVAEPDPNEMAVDQASKTTETTETAKTTAPGTFTFRSDKTIQFGGASPSGFGAAPGQSSVRAVRESIKPSATTGPTSPSTEMPGGFPTAVSVSPASHSNKENAVPSPQQVLIGAPHGMSNKKRRRISADSDMLDVGDDDRASKKRRPEPETSAPVKALGTTPVKKTQPGGPPIGRTPAKGPGRFLGRTQGRAVGRTAGATGATSATVATGSAAPAKKRTTFDMSRINELARPKKREMMK